MAIAFLIRPAEEADRATIRQLVNREHLDPTALKWQNFLIAEHENQIIAIGQIKQLPGCQELGSLVTLPQYRGQGVAGAMIEALEARAERPLYLLCRSKMAPFYRRFGYHEIAWSDAPSALKVKTLPMVILKFIGFRGSIMVKQ